MLDLPGGLMFPKGNNTSSTTSAATIAALMNNNSGGFAGYLGQNLMDGQHELPMLQQQQHDELLPMLQQQQHHDELPPMLQLQQQLLVQQQQAAAGSESDARGPRQHDGESGGSDNPEGGVGSGSGGEDMLMPEEDDGGGGDEPGEQRRPRKKRYHRHTQQQIHALESFFKEVPHPDDKQRKDLSQELGLEPSQVKFWFQNKRTQLKTQQERLENAQLRAENDKLRAENASYRAALATAGCPTCGVGGGGGGPAAGMSFQEHTLRMENARLRDEIDRASAIAAKFLPNPAGAGTSAAAAAAGTSYPPVPLGSHHLMPGADGMFGGIEELVRRAAAAAAGHDKQPVVELAVAAMDELVRMAQLGEPLWLPAVVDGVATEVLNDEEYARAFPGGVGPRWPGLHSEASRYTVVVVMNPMHLVEMLMDANQWSMLFPTIVSRAGTLEVLSTGVAGNCDGALQLMTAEFQMPTPLVPTREGQFVRYCKQQEDGSWAVVDVSLDAAGAGGAGAGAAEGARFRRRPSGCVIQETPSGHARMTWVEHAEAEVAMVHELFRPLVSSGLAFGARRWAAALERQCERLASAMVSFGPATGAALTSPEARRCMLRLAERMVASFCGGLAASPALQWTTVAGSEPGVEMRVATHRSVADPGRPSGVLLFAGANLWLPVPAARLFAALLRDASRRDWDVLATGGAVQEMARIANGRDHGNAATLLRVDVRPFSLLLILFSSPHRLPRALTRASPMAIDGLMIVAQNPNSGHNDMLILQESCTDASGSYVVYAPVDMEAMSMVLSGGDPDYVALLPSGFAILPDGPGAGDGGCILTIAFQILVDADPAAKLSLGSVGTVDTLVSTTVQRIRDALLPADAAAFVPANGGGAAAP
ncbi:hypothetical protein ACP4OV_018227 [Aristida adscensionis]